MPNTNIAETKGGKAGVIILQVIAGLALVYVIYLVLIWVLKLDKVNIDQAYDANKKLQTLVVKGFVDAAEKNIRFNTTMPLAGNYMNISPSVNIKGGSQFTYNFWIYISGSATNDNLANKVLFLKGSEIPYNFTITNRLDNTVTVVRNERLVYCPLVQFGDDKKSFRIRFNTLDSHDEVLTLETFPSSDTLIRSNLLNVLEDTWMNISITFEDNVPINEFENGIIVKFYLNNSLYKTGRFSSALKQNYGDLVLFPNDQQVSGVKVSNLAYYNYVLSSKEIEAIVRKGPDATPSREYLPKDTKGSIPVLSDYNTLDLYNA